MNRCLKGLTKDISTESNKTLVGKNGTFFQLTIPHMSLIFNNSTQILEIVSSFVYF